MIIMKDIFSQRLKNARVLAGISQDELVKRIQGMVSKNAISKYEKGQMLADSKVLIALARALSVKPDYFFRPFAVEINNIEFRKKSKLTVKKSNSIKQRVIDVVERYLELEEFLDIKSDFINPIKNLKIKNVKDVERAANKLLKEWNLGLNALPNIIELLEDKEVKVIEIDAPDEFDGFSGFADSKYPIVVINEHYTIERKRLTALHELGHLLLNFNKNITQKDKEKMCFQFAGALLIPEETFRKEVGSKRTHISIPEMIAIKENYGISIQAIMIRARGLEIINEPSYIKFWKWISNNKSENGLGQYIGKEKSARFKKLIYWAASEEVISMSKAANLSNQKLAEFRKEFVSL